MNLGKAIDALIAKQDLSAEITYDLFSKMIHDEETRMNQGAFLAAITAKGATEEEIAAIQKVIYEFDTAKAEVHTAKPLAENSGTGMDAFKTFNISTAAAVVASACGVAMARHGSRAITSTCGTVDVVEALGVTVEMESCDVGRAIETCGIGLFNGMSPRVHPVGLGRILSEISFGTVLNIAASLANPVCAAYGVRGVNHPDMMMKTAKIMKNIGYKKVFVLHGYLGEDTLGIDEASTLGRTAFIEIDEKGNLNENSFYPEDFGLKRPQRSEIAAIGDVQREACRLTGVLSGEKRDACSDIVLLNAALLLYTTGVCPTLQSGFITAEEALFSGKAYQQLENWVATQQSGDAAAAVRRLAEMKGYGQHEVICG